MDALGWVAVAHLPPDDGRAAPEDPLLTPVEVTDLIVLVDVGDVDRQCVDHGIDLLGGQGTPIEDHRADRQAPSGCGGRLERPGPGQIHRLGPGAGPRSVPTAAGPRRWRRDEAVPEVVRARADLGPALLADQLETGRDEDLVLPADHIRHAVNRCGHRFSQGVIIPTGDHRQGRLDRRTDPVVHRPHDHGRPVETSAPEEGK